MRQLSGLCAQKAGQYVLRISEGHDQSVSESIYLKDGVIRSQMKKDSAFPGPYKSEINSFVLSWW